jgi:hypothetical protein
MAMAHTAVEAVADLETTASPLRQALYRCLVDIDADHAMSASATCADIPGAHAEARLGYTSLTRTSDTPRSLRQCVTPPPAAVVYYHHLDAPCNAGDRQVAHLGFVH